VKEKKIVNYKDYANTVTIEVGDQSFDISRLTMQIRELYGEYNIFSGEYAKSVYALNEESKKLAMGNNVEGLEVNYEKMTNLIEGYAKGKAERIQNILTILLDKNGYKFDEKFWEENADYQFMEWFIIQCMNKDVEEKAPKKKLEES